MGALAQATSSPATKHFRCRLRRFGFAKFGVCEVWGFRRDGAATILAVEQEV